MGRVPIARHLLALLPPELSSLRAPAAEAHTTEYMHYRLFFVAWEALERVQTCQALERPQMTVDTRAAWLGDYTVRLCFSLFGGERDMES